MEVASTSKVSLNSLPDDAIYQILKKIRCSNEIQKLRGVSKRFKRVIHSQGYGLVRPKIDCLKISFDHDPIPQGQIGILRAATIPKANFNLTLFKSNRKVPHQIATIPNSDHQLPKSLTSEMLLTLSLTLKRYSVCTKLQFHQVVITNSFIKIFLKPFVDIKKVEELEFSYCTFEVSTENLMTLIEKTACKSLRVVYCHGAEKVINNKLITSIKALSKLKLQAYPYQPSYNISDDVLNHWMSNTLPTTVSLLNCQTNLTPAGISTFLSKVTTMFKTSPQSVISYDLGTIQAHANDVKQFATLNRSFNSKFLINPEKPAVTFQSYLFNLNNSLGQSGIPAVLNYLKSANNPKTSNFEITFNLDCNVPQTFELKNQKNSAIPKIFNYKLNY